MEPEISLHPGDDVGHQPSNRSHLLPAETSSLSGNVGSCKISEQTEEQISVKIRGSVTSQRCLNTFLTWISPPEMCPSNSRVHYISTRLEIYAMLCAMLYVVLSFSWAESIRDPALQLVALFVLAQIFGVITGIARLPPLLGMLLAGLLLRNVNLFYADGAFLKFTATLRSCAMTVILLRAGLGLDASALRRLSMVVLRVATFPCLVEAIIVAILSHFLLNFPWQWGFLLGFVLGAVSPAVVVPSLLMLKRDGYGEDKGISTLVIAASSMDDIFAITMFGVFLSTIFLQGSVVEMILQGPLELLIGITWGVLMGVISIYIPHSDEESVVKLRTVMVGVSGLLAVLGSQLVGYAGAGPLGCIAGAFVASCGWRAFSPKTTYEPVMVNFFEYWHYLQPFLFGLIGTEIDLSALDGHTIGLGLVVLVIGVLVRSIVCCLAVQGCGLNIRETLFIGLSWLPKATVQAAIGPVALDLARNSSLDQDKNIQLAKCVLTIAVLSILVTAPLGAMGILSTGPLLLSRSETNESIIDQKSDSDHKQNRERNAESQTIP